MKKKDVGYLRVSTEAQTEKYGLEVQQQKINEYAEKNNITIDKWYIDGGYSGSELKRPKIQELLTDAERGEISRVFIYKLDRMSRDAIDTLTLLYRILPKYGVQIISMTEELRFDTPMDKVVVGVNALMNQYEREVIYMRTRAGMVERVKSGLWMGGGRVPYGYYYDRNDGILHIKEDEAEKVKEVFRLYIEGYSCEKISHILGLNSEKLVINILQRKINIGLIEYKGIVYNGKHEPIISEDIFNQAQECIKRRSNNSFINNNNILTGLCRCGKCGARMRYQKWGKYYHKLICYSQQKGKEYMRRDHNCDNVRPVASDIEKEVERHFKEFLINIETQQDVTKSNISIIEESIKKSVSKLKRLYNLYAENDTDSLLEVIQSEEIRLENLKSQLNLEMSKESKQQNKDIESIKKMSDVWDTLSGEEKNKILKQCVEKIVITDNDLEIHFITA